MDFIALNAFAEATGPFSDLNPFADPQTLSVYEINIRIQAEGNNKTLAECQYTPLPGDVVFESTPH